MTSQASCILIYVSQVDALLAGRNMTRPYIYVAFDESRRVLAAKVYAAMNKQSSIDFINHVVAHTPFSVHTICTERNEEFQGEFDQHLEELGIQHEFIVTDDVRAENPLEVTVRSTSYVPPQYKGVVERHFRALNATVIRWSLEEDVEVSDPKTPE